jgi:hypothetical protein
MRKSMLLTAFIAVLLGCSSDQVTDPGPGPGPDITPHSGFFVSVDGSQTGDGSRTNPWALATALAQPGLVKPGDTIWMRGGTYKGNFVSTLTGTPSAPVVLRQFPGERATIDGRLDINGQYAYYWGFEVTFSDPQRSTAVAGSDPTNFPRERVTVFVTGAFNKIINLVLHDLGDGLFSGSPAEGLEIYGTLVYNNGWIGPDRGHGHGLYLQNRYATKRVIDNVIFNNFSTGLKTGGSDQAFLMNFQIEGNSVFANGGPAVSTFGWQTNMHAQGGAGNFGNITYSKNSVYHVHGMDGGAFQVGAFGELAAKYPVTLTDNIAQGSSQFNVLASATVRRNKFTSGSTPYDATGPRLVLVRLPSGVQNSAYDWDGNSVAYVPSAVGPYFKLQNNIGVTYTDLTAWQQATGWDASGAFKAGEFTGIDVVFRPNLYESGRATVTVWNWARAASVTVDPSAILKSGESYTVHHVYDSYGPPVASGTFSGQPITLPLRDYTPAVPLGMTGPPPSTGIGFNVFIIRKS